MASLQASGQSPGKNNPEEAENAESYLGQLYRGKTGAAPQSFKMAAPAPATSQKTVRVPVLQPMQVRKSTTTEMQSQVRSTKTPTMVTPSASTVATDKLQRDCEFLRAICSAYGNNPPTDKMQSFPQLCQQLSATDACTHAAH